MTTYVRRHAIRCRDCLSVFFVEGDTIGIVSTSLLWEGQDVKLPCPCGGAYEYMGRVKEDTAKLTDPDTLEVKREKCACDERCTSACGPLCTCKCGGVNHGTGKVIEIVIEVGAPRACVEIEEKALAQAEEWRAQWNAYQLLVSATRLTTSVPYWERARFHAAARGAEKLRTHKSRMLRIAKACGLMKRNLVASLPEYAQATAIHHLFAETV